MKHLKTTFFAAFMLVSGSVAAKELCVSHDQVIQFEIEDNGSTWFTEALPGGEHRSFSALLKEEEGRLVFENYATRIVMESLSTVGDFPASLFVDGEFQRSFDFHCESYQLKTQSVWKTSFSIELKKAAMGLPYGESKRMKLGHQIKEPASFEFGLYARNLSFNISDIGDWYVVDLNAQREALIQKYLEKEAAGVLGLIKKQQKVEILGHVFSRDWYYGNGYVGIVLKKADDLLILPVAFENNVLFGDEKLDHMY